MNDNKQQGVVSLFVVIFTTLLLTVLVVGFLRLMIQEQKQATNQDLSQSAYDSAMSGVEDAKRVLRACAQGGPMSATACDAINAEQCATVSSAGIVSAASAESSETIIKADGASTDVNQGYTCVLIERQTQDYIGNLTEGESQIVALKASGTDGIRKITIEWMHKNNGSSGSGFAGGDPDHIEQPTATAGVSLPPKAGWHANAPAMLRVQAVLPPDPNVVTTAQLDTNVATTTYLRPSLISDVANSPVTLPGLRATSGTDPVVTSPVPVQCSDTAYTAGEYACRITLTVPASINGGAVPLGSTVAFLRLSSVYRNTSYRITLENNTGALMFDGVQPTVDSTGRAANVYRRVLSRLEMSSVVISPAVIDITGSLCKNFYVTDTSAGHVGTCNTDPSAS